MLRKLSKKSSKQLIQAFKAVSKAQNKADLSVNTSLMYAKFKTTLKNELIKRGIDPRDLTLA